MSQFIQTVPALRELDIADSKIPQDVLKTFVANMALNPMLVDLVCYAHPLLAAKLTIFFLSRIVLCLQSFSLGSCEIAPSIGIVADMLSKMSCVSSLNLSDNGIWHNFPCALSLSTSCRSV